MQTFSNWNWNLEKILSGWFSNLTNWNLNLNGSYIISDEKFSEDELKLEQLGLEMDKSLVIQDHFKDVPLFNQCRSRI